MTKPFISTKAFAPLLGIVWGQTYLEIIFFGLSTSWHAKEQSKVEIQAGLLFAGMMSKTNLYFRCIPVKGKRGTAKKQNSSVSPKQPPSTVTCIP